MDSAYTCQVQKFTLENFYAQLTLSPDSTAALAFFATDLSMSLDTREALEVESLFTKPAKHSFLLCFLLLKVGKFR